MFRLAEKKRKSASVIGILALGLFSMMFLTGSTQPNGEKEALVQIEQSEYKSDDIQLVQIGQVEQASVDMGVNPFVETASETGSQTNEAGNKGGNYRNLPAIPIVSPPSQPRPVLPLPSIPRATSQNQPAVASAPAKVAEPAPAENKEAKIAFLGGGEIMFAHGIENDK